MNQAPLEIDLEARLGPLDPPYQTHEERQIGRALDHYGILFFYRQQALVYDQGKYQIWYPSFTLPSYDGLVIDMAGGENATGEPPTDPRYPQAVYRANGMPAVIVEPADLKTEDWPARLYQRIQAVYDETREAYPMPLGGYRR